MSDAPASSAVDVRALALSAGRLAGEMPLSDLERLVEESQGDISGRFLRWSALAEMRTGATGLAEPWLHLSLSTCIPLTCQRCLGPVDTELDVTRSFRFVETEALAEAQDEASEEDVLALSPDFNLVSLMEDEVLLALPLIARHQTCPTAVRLSAQDPGFEQEESHRQHPFAALAGLVGKTGTPPQ